MRASTPLGAGGTPLSGFWSPVDSTGVQTPNLVGSAAGRCYTDSHFFLEENFVARMIGAVASSHSPTIGFAPDRQKQDDVTFFMLEKPGAAVGVSNLHIYAAMRGEQFEEFLKTRNQPGVLYSVAGRDAKKLDWEKSGAGKA